VREAGDGGVGLERRQIARRRIMAMGVVIIVPAGASARRGL
jgi:hypothetical protein